MYWWTRNINCTWLVLEHNIHLQLGLHFGNFAAGSVCTQSVWFCYFCVELLLVKCQIVFFMPNSMWKVSYLLQWLQCGVANTLIVHLWMTSWILGFSHNSQMAIYSKCVLVGNTMLLELSSFVVMPQVFIWTLFIWGIKAL